MKFTKPLKKYLLTCQANSDFLGRFFCTGQQQLWRPSWNFKMIFSRPLFTIIFKPKVVSNLRKNIFLCIVWHQKSIVQYIPMSKNNLVFLNFLDYRKTPPKSAKNAIWSDLPQTISTTQIGSKNLQTYWHWKSTWNQPISKWPLGNFNYI